MTTDSDIEKSLIKATCLHTGAVHYVTTDQLDELMDTGSVKHPHVPSKAIHDINRPNLNFDGDDAIVITQESK